VSAFQVAEEEPPEHLAKAGFGEFDPSGPLAAELQDAQRADQPKLDGSDRPADWGSAGNPGPRSRDGRPVAEGCWAAIVADQLAAAEADAVHPVRPDAEHPASRRQYFLRDFQLADGRRRREPLAAADQAGR